MNNYSEQDRQQLRRIGATIAKLRLERNMSQEYLAELAEINPKYLSDVERGIRNIAVLNLLRIGKALNVRMGEIFDVS